MTGAPALVRTGALATVVAATMLGILAIAPSPARAAERAVLRVQTQPHLEGIRVLVDGEVHLTDGRGRVEIVTAAGRHRVAVLPPRRLPEGTTLRFVGWLGHSEKGPREVTLPPGIRDESAGFVLSRSVSIRVLDQEGRQVPPGQVERMTLVSSRGRRYSFTSGSPTVTLKANRVVRNPFGLVSTPIRYSLQEVLIGGVNVVHRGAQSFYAQDTAWAVEALLFPLRIEVRDALFGFSLGESVQARGPGGESIVDLDDGHAAELAALPRGSYTLTPSGPGFGLSSTTSLSRPQVARLLIVSWVDIAAMTGFAALFLIGLPVLGGRLARRRGTKLPGWRERTARRSPSRGAKGPGPSVARVDLRDAERPERTQ